jgi:uncharacterized protein YabN with tetrapyrrole methylase and pyrophosphatase domain
LSSVLEEIKDEVKNLAKDLGEMKQEMSSLKATDFDKYDTDGNNSLSRNEFKNMIDMVKEGRRDDKEIIKTTQRNSLIQTVIEVVFLVVSFILLRVISTPTLP